jgi:hypothetical protein
LPALSPFELDRMILSAMSLSWLKTARIIRVVFDECEAKGIEISDQEIADRIIALDAAGMINSDGDLTQWRDSEVCLKPEEGG